MMRKSAMAMILFGLVAGCNQTATVKDTHAAAMVSPERAIAACNALFEKEAGCTDQFIPMLVDTRIKLDVPKGIKDGSRDELIAKAKEEWAVDSVDPKRGETCKAKAPGMPEELVAKAEACAQAKECAALVACVQPLHEAMLSRQQ
jgi:hypothetical protein